MSSPVVVATGGRTPAAGDTSFRVMKEDVAASFGLDGDRKMTERAGRFIRDIIDELNLKQLWNFNIVSSTPIATVAGVSSYSIPSDFWKIYNARKSNDVDFQLDVLRQKTFDSIFLSQREIVGQPYILVIKNTFRDGTVTLFPTPDGAHSIPINYFKLIGKPGSDEEPLDMPLPCQVVVKYGARARLAASIGQPADHWNALYEETRADMTRSDDDIGDENLRLVNVEEIQSRLDYGDPNTRPRAYDLW